MQGGRVRDGTIFETFKYPNLGFVHQEQVMESPAKNTVLSGEWVSPRQVLHLVGELRPEETEAASTLCLRPGEQSAQLAALGAKGVEWRQKLEGQGPGVLDSGCGVIGLRAGGRTLMVVPPFPVLESRLAETWDDAPLRALLEAEYTVGVVLVRLGRYSVALYESGKLVSSKTDSRYVKGKHHAGGTSQLRYTRIREGQARKLYDKVCKTVQAQFQSVRLDYLFLGGEKFTLTGLLKVCPALAALGPITLKRRLNIRDPKRDTLAHVGEMLRESRVWTTPW